MTKLLIATGIFHPESGGPATYLYHVLPHLQANGYDVRVLTYSDDTHPSTPYPYPVTRIPRRAVPLRLAHYANEARRAVQWADMVYQHTLMLPIQVPSRKPRLLKVVGDQAWERAVRNGWVLPTTDVDHFQIRRYWNPLVRLNKLMRRREVRRMDAVIVPSRYLQRMVAGWGMTSQRVHVVYNALPPDHHATHLTRAEARAELSIPLEQPTLLYVGRLTPWKGVDDAIVALQAVPGARLLVAGDGEIRPILESIAHEAGVADRVTFMGTVERRRIPIYMKAADYVVLYSGYEGLSHVLLESLSAGTPVIASNKGGNPEVIRHQQNGFLVEYGHVDALAHTFQEAFVAEQRERLAQHTLSSLETFSFDRMVSGTLAVLNLYR